jgi:hypothetical protein
LKEVRSRCRYTGGNADIVFFGVDGSWDQLGGSWENLPDTKLQFLEGAVEDIHSAFRAAFFQMTQIPSGGPVESHTEIDFVSEAVQSVRQEYEEFVREQDEQLRKQQQEMDEYRKQHPSTGTDDIPF